MEQAHFPIRDSGKRESTGACLWCGVPVFRKGKLYCSSRHQALAGQKRFRERHAFD